LNYYCRQRLDSSSEKLWLLKKKLRHVLKIKKTKILSYATTKTTYQNQINVSYVVLKSIKIKMNLIECTPPWTGHLNVSAASGEYAFFSISAIYAFSYNVLFQYLQQNFLSQVQPYTYSHTKYKRLIWFYIW
jgi:hypothetical protein